MSQVKAFQFEVDGIPNEELECDMIASGLQRLDAQNRERWRLGCKN